MNLSSLETDCFLFVAKITAELVRMSDFNFTTKAATNFVAFFIIRKKGFITFPIK